MQNTNLSPDKNRIFAPQYYKLNFMISKNDHFKIDCENYIDGISLEFPTQSALKNKINFLVGAIDSAVFSRKLNLTFIREPEGEGEVCFANSTYLRDDFRMSFTTIDFLDYLYAVLCSKRYGNKDLQFVKDDIPRVFYPEDTDVFWELVHLGREMHQMDHKQVMVPRSETNRLLKEIDKIMEEAF